MTTKYTLIYYKRIDYDSYSYYLPKIIRFEKPGNETMEQTLEKLNVGKDYIFIFEGYPKLQGE
jgi:hypothetical protein